MNFINGIVGNIAAASPLIAIIEQEQKDMDAARGVAKSPGMFLKISDGVTWYSLSEFGSSRAFFLSIHFILADKVKRRRHTLPDGPAFIYGIPSKRHPISKPLEEVENETEDSGDNQESHIGDDDVDSEDEDSVTDIRIHSRVKNLPKHNNNQLYNPRGYDEWKGHEISSPSRDDSDALESY
jgi:hypothetical protein